MAFSADEVKILEDEHVLLPSPSVLGKRKVSARFLTPPASDGSVSSSGSTASLSFKHYALDPNLDLEIPLSESSPEAFEFYGFTPQVAQEIHHNYCRRPTDSPFDEDQILPWAYGQAHSLNLLPLDSLSPDEALAHIGIKKTLRDGILDPRFCDIFETQSLLFWVKDSLRINYWTLVGLQARLKEHVEHVSKKKGTKAKRGSISNVFPSAASSSQPSATISSASSNRHLPKACVVVQEPAPILDDHVVLYKGKAAVEMVNEFQWIQNNGTLNMNALRSSFNGDFNHSSTAWYFTPEREIAERYRKFVARRHRISETWLIRLQVPKTFLNNLKIQPLWYGADWREYVWHCRTGEQPPSKYDLFWHTGPGNVQVIQGAICSAVSEKVMKIPKDKIHELMTQQEVVMKCGNRNASQVAFMQLDVARNLGAVVQGKIHIEVFAPAMDAEA
ncbi:hypothetical protein GQ44DRAFT_702856 [Phaeosphaeriaceae sp. PMI808]|nr:hypothetical protein GQ44DRAFT_702856 [Phaeosphaeriaceae sp. PMI808]